MPSGKKRVKNYGRNSEVDPEDGSGQQEVRFGVCSSCHGTFPLIDTPGIGITVCILSRSLDNGRYQNTM